MSVQPVATRLPSTSARLAVAALAVAACPLAAQDPVPPPVTAEHYRVVRFAPASGPPGTTVRVNVDELPSITPVYITLGGTSSGFEVLGEMLITNMSGELSETVRIPSWATHDQLHAFVVMDVYFRRLAASEPFHVTASDGTLQRKGEVESVEGACVGLRGEDGELYAVSGSSRSFAVGERLMVEGSLIDSDCPGDVAIRAARVAALPGG